MSFAALWVVMGSDAAPLSLLGLGDGIGEARADAFGPELVARSDDAWRMRSNAMPSIYNMHMISLEGWAKPNPPAWMLVDGAGT